MEKELSFNKKLNEVKLVLSSLFARKLKYLVVNGDHPNVLFFTNIEPTRTEFYASDIDDVLSLVKITDKIGTMIYELFPAFKELKACFDLSKLLSNLNKRLGAIKGEMPKIFGNPDTTEVLMQGLAVTTAENLFDAKKPDENPMVVVGSLITEQIWENYEDILAHFNSFIKEPLERDVTIPTAYFNDKVVLLNIDLPNDVKNCTAFLNMPFQDGTSGVSFREYLPKRKLPWKYHVLVQYNAAKSVAKVAFCHRDDYVDVMSIAPGSIWFPYRKI